MLASSSSRFATTPPLIALVGVRTERQPKGHPADHAFDSPVPIDLPTRDPHPSETDYALSLCDLVIDVTSRLPHETHLSPCLPASLFPSVFHPFVQLVLPHICPISRSACASQPHPSVGVKPTLHLSSTPTSRRRTVLQSVTHPSTSQLLLDVILMEGLLV